MRDGIWKKYEEEVEKRINELSKSGFYLEIVFLFSAILEEQIKGLLDVCEDYIKKNIGIKNVQFIPENFIKKDDATLGKLKNYLLIFVDNEDLIKKISTFNGLRKRVIHKIFSEDIKNLNNAIMKYIPDFYKMMAELAELERDILLEHNKELREAIGQEKYKKLIEK